MATTRSVSWGEGLVVAAFRSEGGLKRAVEAISDLIGPTIGNRNTFAKLLRVDAPELLSEKDQWRAWLLLVAFGENPADWGISNRVVPGSVDPDLLQKQFANWSRFGESNPRPSHYE